MNLVVMPLMKMMLMFLLHYLEHVKETCECGRRSLNARIRVLDDEESTYLVAVL